MSSVVLLVEDKPSLRTSIANGLHAGGFQVLSAADPIEALKVLRQTDADIDVMVCDVLPPFMTGLDLAVRVAERHPNVRALFLSEFRDHVLFPAGGGIEFMRKPFSLQALRRKVQKLASLEKSEVELRI